MVVWSMGSKDPEFQTENVVVWSYVFAAPEWVGPPEIIPFGQTIFLTRQRKRKGNTPQPRIRCKEYEHVHKDI